MNKIRLKIYRLVMVKVLSGTAACISYNIDRLLINQLYMYQKKESQFTSVFYFLKECKCKLQIKNAFSFDENGII